MLKKIKKALVFNTAQQEACMLLSGCMIIACLLKKEEAPWWVFPILLLFWPAIAFLSNLFSPYND